MPSVVAVDLGGTNIRAARFRPDGPPPLAHVKMPTLASEGPPAVLGRIAAAIDQVAGADREGLRIGVGAPGPLDPYRGVIIDAPNLPGWVNIPLRSWLEERFGCPVAVGNDANLAGLAEWRYGAGQGTQHLVFLTISTGIGGGVIIDGRLLVGARGLAAELGHMTVDPGGPPCSCGQRGHLEAVASGPAIARRVTSRIQDGEDSTLQPTVARGEALTAEAVGKAAAEGDTLARAVLREAAEAIGRHLADLAHAFNPEVIVLGGGVSQIGPLLFEPLERALRSHVMHSAYLEGLRVLPAALGDDAGLIGAFVLASEP